MKRGQYICDSYEYGCEWYWVEDEITLSVTDLSKMKDVEKAYDYFGTEALSYAIEDPSFFGMFGRIAIDMEVAYETEDITAYSVPILLNDEEYSLIVIYYFNDEEFRILGAKKGINEFGMASKDLRKLKKGDKITTIHYASSLYGDDDFEKVEIDIIRYSDKTVFEEVDLGEETFVMMFELTDSKNNPAYSKMINITIDGDNSETEIIDW